MGIRWSGLKLLDRLNLERQAITIHDSQQGLYPAVDTAVAEYERTESYKGKIFFPLVEGGSRNHLFRSCVLAHAFRCRGYEPYLLLCDCDLDLCHQKENFDDTTWCQVCNTRGANVAKRFGIDPVSISDVLPTGYEMPDIDGSGPEEYRGISVKEYAIASSRRFLRKYSVNLDDLNERRVYQRFLRSGILLVDLVDVLFDRQSFDATISHHPAYVVGGVVLEASGRRGVPAYAHSSGYRNQNIMFGMARNRSPMAQFSGKTLVEHRMEDPLSGDEETWVDSFMSDRMTGADTREFYAKYSEGGLENSNGERTIGLFTNLLWDGSLSAENIVFNNPFHWLEMTVDWFAEQDEFDLVIKSHPAEEIRGTAQGVYDWIDEHYNLTSPTLSNVEVLQPDTDVGPYTLISQLDAGIVYNSTIGMEMAYEGVPVVVVGDTHYRNLGFTLDPESVDEYEQLLSNIDSLEMTEDMIDCTKRYLHLLFNENHIDFQYHTYEDGSANFNEVAHSDIASDEHLNVIVERIVNGDPVSYRELPSVVEDVL